MEGYKDFYVYEWFDVDTGEVFYVGKGRKYRYKNISQRNEYFKNYYKKHSCDVRKISIGLNESEAFELEKEQIKKYRALNQCKCNFLDGGEGGSSFGDFKFTLLRKLESSPYCKTDHSKLQNMTLPQLIEEDKERAFNKDSYYFLKSLDIYDEQGNLNLGWECFED